MFIGVTFNYSWKSSRWLRSEAISTGSELPNGHYSLIYFHSCAEMGFWLMSIIRVCETCKLHWSEVLWFVTPVGPSVFLLSSLSAVRWPLLPGFQPGFPASRSWGCLWMHGGRSKVLMHRSAYFTELMRSEPLWVLLSVSKIWNGLFQGGHLPFILF